MRGSLLQACCAAVAAGISALGCMQQTSGPSGSLATASRTNPHLASAVCGYRVQGLIVPEPAIQFTSSLLESSLHAVFTGQPVPVPGAQAQGSCGARVQVGVRRQTGTLGSIRGPVAAGSILNGAVLIDERITAPPPGLPATERVPGLTYGGPPVPVELPAEAYAGAKYGTATISGWLLNGWANTEDSFHWHNDYVFDIPEGTTLKFNAWCESHEEVPRLALFVAGRMLGAGRNVPDTEAKGPALVTARIRGICTEYRFSVSRESRPQPVL